MDPQVFYDLTQKVSFDYSSSVYPLVIASHLSDSNQFTLGMTDEGVYVIESCPKNIRHGQLEAEKAITFDWG